MIRIPQKLAASSVNRVASTIRFFFTTVSSWCQQPMSTTMKAGPVEKKNSRHAYHRFLTAVLINAELSPHTCESILYV